MNRFLRRAAAGFLAAAAAVSGTSGMGVCAESGTDAQTLREYAEIFVSMCNDVRVAQGLQEMYVAPVVCDYAQIRAEELTQVFGHTRPNGEPATSVMKNDGFFYNYGAENIAAGNVSPEGTFEQFMNSENHRKNILKTENTHIGIGYCFDPTAQPEPDHILYAYYWSMFLIGTYDSNSTPIVYEGQYIPERECGDADGSKRINAADATRILQYSAARSAGSDPRVTEQFRSAADVNGDGSINAVDAQIVLAYSAANGADPSTKLGDFIWE